MMSQVELHISVARVKLNSSLKVGPALQQSVLSKYGGAKHGALFFSLVFVTGFFRHDCRKLK